MKAILKKYVLPDAVNAVWGMKLAASLLIPLGILLFQPLGLNARQSGVLAGVLLTIIWWSANIVKKIPASVFLLAVFCAVSGAGFQKVFSFPLSETFPMLVVTYLFSRAISNAGILEKIILPVLERTVHTAFACVPAIILTFFLMVYVVPQPLARLIIVAAEFSAAEITNRIWMREMFLPTALVCVLVVGLFGFLFRRQLAGHSISMGRGERIKGFSKREKAASGIILATVLLWMTQDIHGINSTLVTLAAVILLFAIKTLRLKDFNAIDGTTLIFLTAAFSIGGVMEACGAADKVFGLFSGVFPSEFSVVYLWIMVAISMALHMLLGSNTTTLSVVVPGMMLLCGEQVPAEVIVFTAVVSVSFHAILPFHSVSMMMGASDGYFPSGYVTRFGLPATLLVYFAAAAVYLPYWRLTGLL